MPRSESTVAPMGPRRPTDVNLPETLLRDARDLGINLSQACERGLIDEVAARLRQRWLDRNQAAIQGYNEHVARHGLPLAAYRKF